jgi:hypothetical protein
MLIKVVQRIEQNHTLGGQSYIETTYFPVPDAIKSVDVDNEGRVRLDHPCIIQQQTQNLNKKIISVQVIPDIKKMLNR